MRRRRCRSGGLTFAVRAYTVPEFGPHAAEYVEAKRRAERQQAEFDALPLDLRTTINAVGDTRLARELARKGITSHRQAELVKAEIAWQSQEAFW